MKYFTPDYLDFFKELAANNNKQWFDENRKRYQNSVKEPFEKFVKDLILKFRRRILRQELNLLKLSLE